MEISVNISNSDGSSHALERKQCIKYLGVVEVSHRICLFSYTSKYRNYIEIKVLFIYTAVKTNLL